jgi:hypothetical protein
MTKVSKKGGVCSLCFSAAAQKNQEIDLWLATLMQPFYAEPCLGCPVCAWVLVRPTVFYFLEAVFHLRAHVQVSKHTWLLVTKEQIM